MKIARPGAGRVPPRQRDPQTNCWKRLLWQSLR